MERLWTACPELRPERRGWKLAILTDSSFSTREPTWCWSNKHGDVRDPWFPEDAAALIFAACILWLAQIAETEQEKIVPVRDDGRQWGQTDPHGFCIALRVESGVWGIGAPTESGTCQGDLSCSAEFPFENPDPTEACVLAAERVLGLPAWEEA